MARFCEEQPALDCGAGKAGNGRDKGCCLSTLLVEHPNQHQTRETKAQHENHHLKQARFLARNLEAKFLGQEGTVGMAGVKKLDLGTGQTGCCVDRR